MGQHINKASTQVTIRHVPTGIAVTASDSRSQSMNRQLALERLLDVFEKQRAERRQQKQAAISKARRQKAKRSRSTKRKLMEDKRRRGEVKQFRSKSGSAIAPVLRFESLEWHPSDQQEYRQSRQR